MKDYIGNDISTGDIVEITGAYFKADNGFFVVTASEGDPITSGRGLTLHKVGKTGKMLSSGSTVSFWPLIAVCSDPAKNRAAKAHNAENAKIAKVDSVPTWGAAEYFREKERQQREYYENRKMSWGEDHDGTKAALIAADFFAGIAAKYGDVEPPQKEPEKGIRFFYNGIKVDGGKLRKCGYILDRDSVTIYANGYGAQLPKEYFVVKNDTDLYTDYFDTDRATLDEGHPLYKFARYAALKGIMSGKSWRNPTEDQAAEWAKMKDPGQPTPADLAAVEKMKTAAESARIEAEKAAEQTRREETLRKRNEGRRFIEEIAAQNPTTEGAPTVEITFSENPAFYSWTESQDRTRKEIQYHADGTRTEKTIVTEPRRRLVLSVAAAEIVLNHFDEQTSAEGRGYDKTDFVITYADPTTGEISTYSGRYDLGDKDGGLIEHVRSFGHYEKNAEILRLADWLETFTARKCTEEKGKVINFCEYLRRR